MKLTKTTLLTLFALLIWAKAWATTLPNYKDEASLFGEALCDSGSTRMQIYKYTPPSTKMVTVISTSGLTFYIFRNENDDESFFTEYRDGAPTEVQHQEWDNLLYEKAQSMFAALHPKQAFDYNCVPLEKEGAAAPAPQYFPGESWTYGVIEERATAPGSGSRSGMDSGTYEMEILGDGTLNLNPNFARALPSLYEGSTTQSGIEWYRFLLKVGESWPVRRHTSMGWAYGTATVVAKEIVKVPAGTFDTYKLVIKDLTAVSAYGYMSYEYYYAPVVKSAVKVLYKQYRNDESIAVRRSAELSSYSVRN